MSGRATCTDPSKCRVELPICARQHSARAAACWGCAAAGGVAGATLGAGGLAGSHARAESASSATRPARRRPTTLSEQAPLASLLFRLNRVRIGGLRRLRRLELRDVGSGPIRRPRADAVDLVGAVRLRPAVRALGGVAHLQHVNARATLELD